MRSSTGKKRPCGRVCPATHEHDPLHIGIGVGRDVLTRDPRGAEPEPPTVARQESQEVLQFCHDGVPGLWVVGRHNQGDVTPGPVDFADAPRNRTICCVDHRGETEQFHILPPHGAKLAQPRTQRSVEGSGATGRPVGLMRSPRGKPQRGSVRLLLRRSGRVSRLSRWSRSQQAIQRVYRRLPSARQSRSCQEGGLRRPSERSGERHRIRWGLLAARRSPGRGYGGSVRRRSGRRTPLRPLVLRSVPIQTLIV